MTVNRIPRDDEPIASTGHPRLSDADDSSLSDDGFESEVFGAIQEYLRLAKRRQLPARDEFLARYSHVAAELAQALDSIDFIRVADPGMQHPLVGETLGDFVLLREIARGGMGVVYEALQRSLLRHVALKMLPLAAALDSRQLTRFRNEAHWAAQLQHSNIVPVFAVGCERSVHYFAMQLIEGESLASILRQLIDSQASDEVRQKDAYPADTLRTNTSAANSTAETPREPLELAGMSLPPNPADVRPSAIARHRVLDETKSSARDGDSPPCSDLVRRWQALRQSDGPEYCRFVARLMIQAADALHEAHQQGVVHRDVKPGNLLLDRKDHLWVTDFGLARSGDESELTHVGEILGTLRYISPEQAMGEQVDHRTDIYSLGATAYELLTLRHAVTGKHREAMLQQRLNVRCPPMRVADLRIPRGLEIIVTMAMAKDPNERYQTANELAQDLGRFLKHEPIMAKLPSWRYRTARWLRRHRVPLIVATTGLAVIAIGAVLAVALISREKGKTLAAVVGEQTVTLVAEQQQATARQNLRTAQDAVNAFAGLAANQRQRWDLFSQVDTQRQLLETAVAYYQQLSDEGGELANNDGEVRDAMQAALAQLHELDVYEEWTSMLFRLTILKTPEVERVLSLTDHTRLASREFADASVEMMRDEQWRLRRSDQPTQIARMHATLTNIRSRQSLILSAQQSERLQQAARQLRVPRCLLDPEVSTLIELSHQQLDAIRRLAPVIAAASPRERPPQSLWDDAATAARQESLHHVREILSPEQWQNWLTLVGEPIGL